MTVSLIEGFEKPCLEYGYSQLIELALRNNALSLILVNSQRITFGGRIPKPLLSAEKLYTKT